MSPAVGAIEWILPIANLLDQLNANQTRLKLVLRLESNNTG